MEVQNNSFLALLIAIAKLLQNNAQAKVISLQCLILITIISFSLFFKRNYPIGRIRLPNIDSIEGSKKQKVARKKQKVATNTIWG